MIHGKQPQSPPSPPRTKRKFFSALSAFSAVAFVFTPRVALACPVCFGQNDSPLAVAMNLGIVAMLVVVVGMLGAFATFFIYLNRRAKMVAAKQSSEGTA